MNSEPNEESNPNPQSLHDGSRYKVYQVYKNHKMDNVTPDQDGNIKCEFDADNLGTVESEEIQMSPEIKNDNTNKKLRPAPGELS